MPADLSDAGRSCPLHYRYRPEDLNQSPTLSTETLYVVGGLYGNGPALERVLALPERESGPAHLVFNGDFNWFNIDPHRFRHINDTVLTHTATRGNVETELARPDAGAGCGCAYPPSVDDATVRRSNAIMARLQETARGFPALTARLAALPMYLSVAVGGQRVAVLHGDPRSLAGWGLGWDALSDPNHDATLADWFHRSAADVLACSHTCLPALKHLDGRAVINNGAAGMPNFRGRPHGLVSRISLHPPPPDSLPGLRLEGLYLNLVPVDYDPARWEREFRDQWPAGSPAYVSYYDRIVHGPDFHPDQVPIQH